MQAHKTVNMSASTYFVPDFSSIRYLNYGASVSEVMCVCQLSKVQLVSFL